jgi:outer membrane immunogenic protein
MRKFILGSIALIAFNAGNSALAADIPVRMPVKAPMLVAPYEWTGFYAGVNVGYSVARDPSTYTNVDLPFPGLVNDESYKISPAGFVGGVQLGYNWQWANWVVGLEADFQGSGQRDSVCVFQCVTDGTVSGTIVQKLPWFGTVRGRLGTAVDRALFYVTGGLAYGKVETSVTEVSGVFTNTASDSTIRTGWVIGGGIEAALAGNWTGKIEYLYIDLGSQTLFPPTIFLPGSSVTAALRDNVVRGGVNYRFGPPAGGPSAMPVKAPPIASRWTGLYLGVNAGYGVARNPTTYFNSTVDENESFKIMPAGILGGGQLGANWQVARWVVGLEADIQGTGMRDTACVFGCIATPIFDLSGTVTQKLPWFGTARVRLGYAADGALFYLTGGVAYGKVEADITHIQGTAGAIIASASDTKTGGTFGAGVEAPLAGNWSAKAEYLYINLGAQTLQFAFPGGGPTTIVSTSIRESIFRAGLNYRFDWSGPVIAKY